MKRLILILFLLMLMIPQVHADPLPQWEENVTYLYGMSIYQGNGDFLPEAPIISDYLHDGIMVSVQNGMPYEDDCVLMFVLNGYVQPFRIDGRTVYCKPYHIEAKQSLDFKVTFDELKVADSGIQYLHVISVGLLQHMPSDQFDYNDFYSNVWTIPFLTEATVEEVEESTAMEEVEESTTMEITSLSATVFEELANTSGMICFSSLINEEGIFIRPAIDAMNAMDLLDVTIVAPDREVTALLLVNGEPWQTGEKLPSGQHHKNSALQVHYDLGDLEDGEYTACALLLPLSEAVALPQATHRLLLNITTGE